MFMSEARKCAGNKRFSRRNVFRREVKGIQTTIEGKTVSFTKIFYPNTAIFRRKMWICLVYCGKRCDVDI